MRYIAFIQKLAINALSSDDVNIFRRIFFSVLPGGHQDHVRWSDPYCSLVDSNPSTFFIVGSEVRTILVLFFNGRPFENSPVSFFPLRQLFSSGRLTENFISAGMLTSRFGYSGRWPSFYLQQQLNSYAYPSFFRWRLEYL